MSDNCLNIAECCPRPIYQVNLEECEGALLDIADSFCVGAEVSEAIYADWDGSLPFTWELTSGTLPDGLSLTTGVRNFNYAVLSGIPTATGEFTFTVTATDSGGTTASRTYTVTVSAIVDASELPEGTEDTAYSYTFTAEGAEPHIFTAIGELPPGLTLNPSTGELSGTPLLAGTYSFEIAVTLGVAAPLDVAVLGDSEGNQVGDYEGNRIQSRET